MKIRIEVNGMPHQVEAGLTLKELLERLELRSDTVAVEVNRELVSRTRHRQTRLREDDRVEIVTLVGGG